MPYFCRAERGVADLEDFSHEVEGGWLPVLDIFQLPPLTGGILAEVVQRKKATSSSLDGWGWREFKAFPLSWFDSLARILRLVEEQGIWPDGLLDAYIAMIPKSDGDATPLGQRPLCVLPVVYRMWASARMLQLEHWFRSWVPDSVFSAGRGGSQFCGCLVYHCFWILRSALLVARIRMCTSWLLMWSNLLTQLIVGSWIGCLAVWGCLPGLDMSTLSIMLMLG